MDTSARPAGPTVLGMLRFAMHVQTQSSKMHRLPWRRAGENDVNKNFFRN